MNNYKLIIFDCDGVLVDTETISNRILARQVSQLGYPMTTDEALRRYAGGSFYDMMEDVRGLLGKAFPENFEATYRKETYHAFSIELEAIQGIDTVLQQTPLPYCVGSNGPKDKMLLNLKKTDLLDYFNVDHIYSAYDIGIWKPDPRMYETVARNMGVHPHDCIVIEDSILGTKAGIGAGMKVFRYIAHAKESIVENDGVTEFNSMDLLSDLLHQKVKKE